LDNQDYIFTIRGDLWFRKIIAHMPKDYAVDKKCVFFIPKDSSAHYCLFLVIRSENVTEPRVEIKFWLRGLLQFVRDMIF
jgi:hypothetical protein